mmetsp:Transcript_25963/g.74997  ORF Transcript_25963/g.74997 Transcript_25963/m.74997 type:complete len:249 (-) Transcript_25963:174-920(-)
MDEVGVEDTVMRQQPARSLETQQPKARLVEVSNCVDFLAGHVHPLAGKLNKGLDVVLRVHNGSRLLADSPGLGLEHLIVLIEQVNRVRDVRLQDSHIDADGYLHSRHKLEHEPLEGSLPVHAHPYPAFELLHPHRSGGDKVRGIHGQDPRPETLHVEGAVCRRQREELHLGAQVHEVLCPRLCRISLCLHVAGRVISCEEEHAGLELARVGIQVENSRACPEHIRQRHVVVVAIALFELSRGPGSLHF